MFSNWDLSANSIRPSSAFAICTACLYYKLQKGPLGQFFGLQLIQHNFTPLWELKISIIKGKIAFQVAQKNHHIFKRKL